MRVTNLWGVVRGVAGEGAEWREVAWLRRFRPRGHIVKPTLLVGLGNAWATRRRRAVSRDVLPLHRK